MAAFLDILGALYDTWPFYYTAYLDGGASEILEAFRGHMRYFLKRGWTYVCTHHLHSGILEEGTLRQKMA